MSFGLTFKKFRRRFGFLYNYRSESFQVFIRKVKPENYLKARLTVISTDSYFKSFLLTVVLKVLKMHFCIKSEFQFNALL